MIVYVFNYGISLRCELHSCDYYCNYLGYYQFTLTSIVAGNPLSIVIDLKGYCRLSLV